MSDSEWVAPLAVTEHPDPEAEQHVVPGRRAVLAQDARDRRPVMVSDADREALVDPETAVQLARAHQGRQRCQDDEERRDGDPVRQHCPPRACELDAGHGREATRQLRQAVGGPQAGRRRVARPRGRRRRPCRRAGTCRRPRRRAPPSARTRACPPRERAAKDERRGRPGRSRRPRCCGDAVDEHLERRLDLRRQLDLTPLLPPSIRCHSACAGPLLPLSVRA